MTSTRACAVSLLIISMACGDSTGSTGCAANDPLTVAATVDGAAYCGQIDNAFVSTGNLNVASTNAASTLSVNFGVGATVGIKTIGPGVPLSFQVETSAGAIWIASGSVSGSSGSLTIVTLTATSATGTFSCVAQPVSGGAAGSRVVANGSFSVTF
jgi:hypothetical protein